MKKKRILLGCSLVLSLYLIGCGTTQNSEPPVTDVPVTGTPVPTMSISYIFQTQETPAPVDTDTTEVLTEKLELVEASDLASYNAANRILFQDTAGTNNSLFCIDADTGVVYFVNQMHDYYIYRLKDGKAELAVSMPAKELCCWEGKLYFMVEDYDTYELKDMQNGDIYVYTPDNGTVEPVFAAGAMMAENSTSDMEEYQWMNVEEYQRLTVNETGLYFIGGILFKPSENTPGALALEIDYRHLQWGSTEPVKDSKQLVDAGWKDYYLMQTAEEVDSEFGQYLDLLPRDGDFADRIVLEKSNHLSKFFVMENELVLLYEHKIIVRNLATDERVEYDLEPDANVFLKKAGMPVGAKSLQTTALSITEDSIWVVNAAQYVYRIDRQSGEFSGYKLDTSEQRIRTMYTDGTSIYVLTSYGVAKVLTETAEENSKGIPVLKLELLVEE